MKTVLYHYHSLQRTNKAQKESSMNKYSLLIVIVVFVGLLFYIGHQDTKG